MKYTAILALLFVVRFAEAATPDCAGVVEGSAIGSSSLTPYASPIPLDSRQAPFVQSIVDLYLASLGHRAANGALSDFRHSFYSRTLRDQLQASEFIENGWQYQPTIPWSQDSLARRRQESGDRFYNWAKSAVGDLRGLANHLLQIEEKTGLNVTFADVLYFNFMLADLVAAVDKKTGELANGEIVEKGDWNRRVRDHFGKIKPALRVAQSGRVQWSVRNLMPSELQMLLKEFDSLFAAKGILALVVPRNLQVQERLALAPWPIHIIRSATFYRDVSDLTYGIGYDLGSDKYAPGVELIERISSARQTWQSLLNNPDDSAKTDLVRALLLFLRYEMRYQSIDWSDPNNLLRQLMGPILFSGAETHPGRQFNDGIVQYFQESGATYFRPWRFNNITRQDILGGFDEIIYRLLQDSRLQESANPALLEFLRRAERDAVTTQDMVTRSL